MFKNKNSCEDFGALYGSQSIKEYGVSGIPRWFDKQSDLEAIYGNTKKMAALIEQIGYVRKSYYGLFDWALISILDLAKTTGKDVPNVNGLKERELKGYKVWDVPEKFKNDASAATANAAMANMLAIILAQFDIVSVTYRPVYEERYGTEYYQAEMKPVRDTG